MNFEETGTVVRGEGKYAKLGNKVKLLDKAEDLDPITANILANCCNGELYRVKGGEAYAMQLDDKVYNDWPWREEWAAKGWTIARYFQFDAEHNNNPGILVAFSFGEEDAEGDREFLGGKILGYGFNYC